MLHTTITIFTCFIKKGFQKNITQCRFRFITKVQPYLKSNHKLVVIKYKGVILLTINAKRI